MCSERTWIPLAVLIWGGAWVPGAVAGEPGGHRLELGIYAGHLDFDDEIRFDNDSILGVSAAMSIVRWAQLQVDLSHMTMRDRDLTRRAESTTFAIHGEVNPRPGWTLSPLVLAGVSFMAFTESDDTDAISEGLDLGIGARWSISPRWSVRAITMSRMQTFRLVPVSATGEAVGMAEETGYLWSRVWRLGLSYVF